MIEILKNIANYSMIDFCIENKIDCSDSVCIKTARGFKFALVSTKTGRTIVSVTFTKNSRPKFVGAKK